MYSFTANIPILSGSNPSIAPGGSGAGFYTIEADKDFVATKIALPISLASALNGAIAGTELARWPSPTAADNTHVTRAQFRFTLETSAGDRYSSGPVNVAGFFNPEGTTYLEEPIRVPAKGWIRFTLFNDTATATVKADLVLRGVMVDKGAPFNPASVDI